MSREMIHISIYRSSRADDCRSAETGFRPTSSRSFDRVLGTGVLLPVPDPRVPDAASRPAMYRSGFTVPEPPRSGQRSMFHLPDTGTRSQTAKRGRLPFTGVPEARWQGMRGLEGHLPDSMVWRPSPEEDLGESVNGGGNCYSSRVYRTAFHHG